MLRRLAAVLTVMLATAGVATAQPPTYSPADELADFNAAVEQAAAHNRVAMGYLRTGNLDLAAVELQRLHTAWFGLVKLYGERPPAVLRNNPLYAATLHDVRFFTTTAIAMVGSGQIDAARESLQQNRKLLHAMRAASGIEVLADCVLALNGTMAAFFAFEDKPPDWSRPQASKELTGKADTLATTARHCDQLAPVEVRRSPEFRRLIDGIAGSLAFVPTVVGTHDTEMLHRLIGELRAFDQLLTFRYG
jgi:hypothetical protein